MPKQETNFLDPESAEYAHEVASQLRTALGDKLVGVYLHGSAVLGDFVRERSDIDVVALSDGPLTVEEKHAIVERLSSESLRCPASGLEFHVVDRHAVDALPDSPAFELHIATKSSESSDRVVDGHGHSGDSDLLMHFAVLHDTGVRLSGPPASEIFPKVPRERMVQAFAGELRWALEHASPTYQVLNACRASRFLEENVLTSKLDGGEWARRRLKDSTTIDDAIQNRLSRSESEPDPIKARALVEAVLSQLDEARSLGLRPGS